MKPFSRRTFLKIAGVIAAGAAGASAGRKQGPLPNLGEAEAWPDLEERWVASVCQLCPGGCGIRARVVDGRLVKVEGNPFHPVNRGRLCPVGQAAPQFFHHPDRLRTPAIRTPGGELRRASWDEAISFLAQALKGLRDRGEAHTAVFLAGPFRGLRDRLVRRFMAALGSPNYVRAREAVPEEPDPAHTLAQGAGRPLFPDLFGARSILSFGIPLLEGGPSPVYQMRAYGHFRQGKGRPRGVLIQVEPRRSATAERADKWVAVRPGAETTLALGIAHALILEHLFDEGFVAQHCEGFEDEAGPEGRPLPGFRTIVLREFTLPRVSQMTGVPVETILGAARAFARNQPGVALAPAELPGGSARLGLRLAVHMLNALVGNLGKPGGMLPQGAPPLREWKPPQLDAQARRSLARPRADGAGAGVYLLASDASETLPERILSGEPYPVNALLVAGTDPLFDHPRAAAFARAIERVPLVVSFASMPTAIAEKAHLLLPDATFFERWTEDAVAHLGGFTAFSVGQPVVRGPDSPPGLEETLLRVAQKMGGALAESFPWKSFSEAIYEAAAPLAEAGRGYVVSDPVAERFRAVLTRQGYWQREFENPRAFWEALLQRGAWWDTEEGEHGAAPPLGPPSGKFHFFPRRLGELLGGLDPDGRREAERALGLRALDGRLLPADPPRAEPREGQLELLLFRPLALIGPAAAELPWLQEQLGPHVGAQWDSWVEVHPEDAKRLGLHHGDPVEVLSGAGRLRTRARPSSGVLPGTAAMPVGLGRPRGGRWAKGRGADPRRLTSPRRDPLRGMGTLEATPVRLRRTT